MLSEDVGGFRGAIAELRAELLHEGVHPLGSKRLDPAADQVLLPGSYELRLHARVKRMVDRRAP